MSFNLPGQITNIKLEKIYEMILQSLEETSVMPEQDLIRISNQLIQDIDSFLYSEGV